MDNTRINHLSQNEKKTKFNSSLDDTSKATIVPLGIEINRCVLTCVSFLIHIELFRIFDFALGFTRRRCRCRSSMKQITTVYTRRAMWNYSSSYVNGRNKNVPICRLNLFITRYDTYHCVKDMKINNLFDYSMIMYFFLFSLFFSSSSSSFHLGFYRIIVIFSFISSTSR